MTTGTPPMMSVQRAFKVIEVLLQRRAIGPSELSDRLDLPKSTAHLYLRSLEEAGYLVNDGGSYELSYQFLTIGSQLKFHNRLFQVAKRDISDLTRETEELVTLIVEQGGRSFILHQEMGDKGLELGTYPGQSLPLHTHASGKVFLAYMDTERKDAILDEHGLHPVTEETITDRGTLEAEIDRIREAKYAYDWNEQVRGMGVISVPLVVATELKGVLAIACPTGRITNKNYRQELLQHLRSTVDTITIKYQYGT
ncbi:IclR family transcriptional regulator domain-containing protein [Halobellus sp. GM3]|uniref:IclR family transcriptional regulator domain-containing protein n=1 Tax=Halobellus sp. GM3 TaxID=3458410 RepID=UPI00403E1744